MKQQQSNSKNSHNVNIGKIGESLVCRYVAEQGYTVLDRNFRKKWGEIDVVAQKDSIIHFIEVKTVSYETVSDLRRAVSAATWRPEENVHKSKVKRLHRAIESWLLESYWQGSWQIDVFAVRVVPRETYATIKSIENIIID